MTLPLTRRRFNARLFRWHAGARRPLLIRTAANPWEVLVAEVMSQQTGIERVGPMWRRFVDRWATPASLAGAGTQELLAAWAGLGYNRRALALRDAARVVASGGWPADLTSLPGVGPYTAAAVSSFAWDAQVAAVDTNVRRVLSRRDGVERTPRELAARAASLLPAGRAATFNQAMMELGATVCRPRAPVCEACPVSSGCHGPQPVVRRRSGPAVRFEDTDRWARGRVVAALLADAPLPALEPARRTRVLAGLVRDGLVVTAADGSVRLP